MNFFFFIVNLSLAVLNVGLYAAWGKSLNRAAAVFSVGMAASCLFVEGVR